MMIGIVACNERLIKKNKNPHYSKRHDLLFKFQVTITYERIYVPGHNKNKTSHESRYPQAF